MSIVWSQYSARKYKAPERIVTFGFMRRQPKFSQAAVMVRSTMEPRNQVRYELAANAVFTWESAQNSRLLGKGVTRDLSSAGAFILTLTSPPVGTTLELEIFLPPLFQGARRVRIKTEATVIRVEHSRAREGFAVVGQDFSLLPGETKEK